MLRPPCNIGGKYTDVYLGGETMALEFNKIHNIDCIKRMKLLQDNSIDLIVTDPPFKFRTGKDTPNNFFTKRHKKHIKNIKDSFGHDFNPTPFLRQIKRLMKKINVYVWTSKDNIPIYLNWAVSNGYNFNILTWHKNNPMPLWKNTYRPDTEYCIFIREKGAYFNSNLKDKTKYKKYWITNIGTGASTKNIDHPSPKPLEIFKTLIEVSSKPNDVILDCYMGSGTTAIACKLLNRISMGFEIDSNFCDTAMSRLSQTLLRNVGLPAGSSIRPQKKDVGINV